VHRITKARAGREPVSYFFYTRRRNTPDAWPSIPLPEPLTAEFAPSVAICEALERTAEGFRLYGADLPDLRTAEFWPKAFELHKAKLRRDHGDAKDFTALVESFKAHEAYTVLEPSTRRGYDRSADMIIAAWAFDLPAELTTVDAQLAIDELGDTPATANQFRAFLSRLMAWGVPRGFCTGNPVAMTEKIKGGEAWIPWPPWAFETFLAHAPIHLLLPMVSVLFTGQRQGDILGMRRPKSGDKIVEVKAQKTNRTVWIPIHSEYRRWIDRAPGNSTALHVGVKGLPYQTTDGFRSEWQRLMKTDPFKPFRENRLVFHGLRKNAVINLLEVGCTESEVGAIANMSEQMVRHYGRDVSLRRLAANGMERLERRWAEVRPAGMEQEQNENWKPARRIGNRWEGGRPE
jgi:integrase